MKLLIATQAVDVRDPVLGFFVRWIEECAAHTEKLTVICLREGEHTLPSSVRVIPLGNAPKLVRLWRLWSACIQFRKDYDRVLVHMNPEYVLGAGVLWKCLGKRIGLWYTHKSVNVRLRLAVALSDVVYTASRESFRLSTPKLRIVGHGIDTDFFSPRTPASREVHLLSVGRLTKSKRHDLAVRAAALTGKPLRVVGEGPEREVLEALAHTCGASVHFVGGVTQKELRQEYENASVLVHTSETGSLDKVVLEALAMDTPVVTTSGAYEGYPVEHAKATPEAIADILRHPFPPRDRAGRIREEHSLKKLIPRLLSSL